MNTPVSAWFDCSSGVAGDMLLGALLDAGAGLDTVQRAVDAVAPGSVRIRTEQVRRCGLAATRVHVEAEPGPPHRTWHAIRTMLARAALPEAVRERAHSVFLRLARAEAAAHGIAVDDVHFHEVGALDAIADVVGVCAAVHELGVTAAAATPVTLGSGRASGAHGRIPVPAPAVLRLLTGSGAPARSGGFPHEMATPTGVALLLTLCAEWGGMPELRLAATGTGAGTREIEDVPNVVRVVLGTTPPDDGPSATQAVVVDANVDDLDPRIWPQVLTRLLEAGASDAWLTPILMKKGRPAHMLSALCPPPALPAVRETITAETSTIGTREHRVDKRELEREFTTVRVGEAFVRVKVARYRRRIVNVQPEYEDVVAAAGRLGIPVKTALARSIAAAEGAVENQRCDSCAT